MNEKDRELFGEIKETLGRLDERSINTYTLAEKLEQHMVVQNESLTKHGEGLAGHDEAIEGLKTGQGRQWKILGGMFTLAISALITKLKGLW